MKMEDVRDLFAYLKTLPPVEGKSRDHDLPFYLKIRRLLGGWKFLYLDGRQFQPDPAKSAEENRGAYLVNGPGHCAECHTPRRFDGSTDDTKLLAGGPGPERSLAANITPHDETGIGRWTEAQIARFLRTGVKPSGQEAYSLMRAVIIGTSAGFKDLTEADALAIARYLKTVPPIENKVR
jgi:mono/diheme cytochrome c family protein